MSPLIIGHRGAAGHSPENTRASIQKAIALGLSHIEVDIQPCQDGTLVVCHDHTLERCSNGTGRVDETPLIKLKTLDFGAWFSAEFAGERLLTLQELLSIANAHSVDVNIEIKVDEQHDPQQVVQQLKKEMAQAGITDPRPYLLSSFSPTLMRQLHHHLPQYRLGVICDRYSDPVLQLLKEVEAFSCHINYRHIKKEVISTLRCHGFQIWCFTVNSPDDFPLLSQVDALFSDYPERFRG